MKSTVGICVMKTYQMIIIKTDHLDEKGRETFEEALEDFCDCTFYQLDTNTWLIKESTESPQDVFSYLTKFIHELDIIHVYGISEAYMKDPSQNN